MAHINNKMLLIYGLTVFPFFVFFFVTNHAKLPQGDPNTKENVRKVNRNETRTPSLQENREATMITKENVNIKKKMENREDQNPNKHENPSPAAVAPISKKQIMDKKFRKEIFNFMKFIQQQMSNMNSTIRGLPQWNEHEDLNRKLQETLRRSPSIKALPMRNVTHDHVKLDCEKEYDVIFFVTSYAGNFERRAWIRTAWGASETWLTKKNWKVIFNVGTVNKDATMMSKVKNESMQFNDVLCLDVPEDFHKLSEKVMVALQWVYQRAKFNFVLKTDDDIFIHVDRVISLLAGEWSHEDFIGNVMAGQPPTRVKGRYFVTKEEWSGEVYDPYCSGGGFILSNSIIGKMIPHFNWVKPLKIDDAYVGHLVKLAGGHPLHAPDQFLMWNDKGEYDYKFIVSHPVKTEKYRDFLMGKALIEMGKVKERGHKYENVTSLTQYNEMIKTETKVL